MRLSVAKDPSLAIDQSIWSDIGRIGYEGGVLYPASAVRVLVPSLRNSIRKKLLKLFECHCWLQVYSRFLPTYFILLFSITRTHFVGYRSVCVSNSLPYHGWSVILPLETHLDNLCPFSRNRLYLHEIDMVKHTGQIQAIHNRYSIHLLCNGDMSLVFPS